MSITNIIEKFSKNFNLISYYLDYKLCSKYFIPKNIDVPAFMDFLRNYNQFMKQLREIKALNYIDSIFICNKFVANKNNGITSHFFNGRNLIITNPFEEKIIPYLDNIKTSTPIYFQGIKKEDIKFDVPYSFNELKDAWEKYH